MIAPRSGGFFLAARKVRLFFGGRPKTSLGIGISLCLVFSLGVFCWLHYDLWAAQRAFRLDLLADADHHIESYLHLKPDDLDGHLLAARIARLLQKYGAAEKHLEECQRIGGTSERTQLEWFLLRAQKDDFSSCEARLQMNAENGKMDQRVEFLETLTFCYLRDLRFRSAQPWLEKWLKREPDSVRALAWRGSARENLDLIQEAKEDYQRLLELSPQHARRLDLVNILLAETYISLAAEHLEILQQADADNPAVLYALALCRKEQGRAEEAQDYLNDLLARQPDNARALYLRGQLERDPAEQEAWFRKALKTDASSREVRFSLYASLQQQGKPEAKAERKRYMEAVAAWASLSELVKDLGKNPQNPDALAKVGDLLVAVDPTMGKGLLETALRISPHHRLANEALARFYEGKKEPEKAAHYRTAVK
jgi:tetratricopeptide (TPR) repeat protein